MPSLYNIEPIINYYKRILMKLKKRKRGSVRSYTARKISKNSKDPNLLKMFQCQKIIQQKTCEICLGKQGDQIMILCDECDDAYHWTCLKLPSLPSQSQIWICPNCAQMQHEINQDNKNTQHCYKCSQKISETPKLKYICEGISQTLQLDDNPQYICCVVCKQYFHPHCFSHRRNSLNCWPCESKLRAQTPKNHEGHLQFLNSQLQVVHKRGYFQLQAVAMHRKQQQHKPGAYMGLKIFQELTDWQLITRYEASLYYALKSKQLTFCDQQIYASKQQMQLNDCRKQIIKASALHPLDEKVYELFKAKIRKGAVGSFQIRQDREIGFYLVSLGHIEKGTIISEYAGQVDSHRNSLTQKNDSIFTLLTTGRSKQDLNIIPKRFGNASRFICGVNDTERQNLRKVNTMSIRFAYKGRIRIIFVAKKNIEKGDIFYLNYNAGTYQEYPTYDFV